MLLLEFIIIQTVHFPKIFEILTVSLLSFCIIMNPRTAVLLISLPLFSSLATSHVSISNFFSFPIGYFAQPSFPLPFLNDTCLLTLLLGLSLRYLKVYSSENLTCNFCLPYWVHLGNFVRTPFTFAFPVLPLLIFHLQLLILSPHLHCQSLWCSNNADNFPHWPPHTSATSEGTGTVPVLTILFSFMS